MIVMSDMFDEICLVCEESISITYDQLSSMSSSISSSSVSSSTLSSTPLVCLMFQIVLQRKQNIPVDPNYPSERYHCLPRMSSSSILFMETYLSLSQYCYQQFGCYQRKRLSLDSSTHHHHHQHDKSRKSWFQYYQIHIRVTFTKCHEIAPTPW